jgi:ParB/RepB/Spo0J family partition protein
MRADAHYVDALMSRSPAGRDEHVAITAIEPPGEVDEGSLTDLVESIRRHGVLQPLIVQKRKGRHRLISGRRRLAAAIEVGLREVPCLIHDVGHDEAKALAEASNIRPRSSGDASAAVATASRASGPADSLLEQSLETLTACATALGSVASSLSRTGVTDLVRAEAWRATSLALAARLMRSEIIVKRTSVPVTRLIDGVVDAFGPELHVRGAAIDTDVSPRSLHVSVDGRVVAALLTHALFLTLAVVEGCEGARLRVAASVNEADELTLAVSQTSAGVPPAWASRAFDEGWSQRPGGDAALVAAAALQDAARLLEGRCQLTGSPRSTRILVAIPASDS